MCFVPGFRRAHECFFDFLFISHVSKVDYRAKVQMAIYAHIDSLNEASNLTEKLQSGFEF